MKKSIRIVLDVRFILALVLIVLLLLLAWRPLGAGSETRKITVAGHAQIKAQPDYYDFTVLYQRSDKNREAALEDLNDHAESVINALYGLGLERKDIKLQTTAFDQSYADPTEDNAVTARLLVRASNPQLAERVQDYLQTTEPAAGVMPIPGFSDEKRKNLQNEARDKAVADAKSQAERTARQLGTKLGKVIELTDTVAGDVVFLPYEKPDQENFPAAVGEQEIGFSVQAVFEIK